MDYKQRDLGPQARRESAAMRRRKHRHRMAVLYIFLMLAVVAGGVVLSLTVLFKITAVEVSGSSRYSATQIIKESGVKVGENLFLADADAATAQITRQLPYIGTVQVRRALPSTIYLEVREAAVTGAVVYGERFVVFGEGGKVLELADTPPEGYPIVWGLSLKTCVPGTPITYADEKARQAYADLLAAMEEVAPGNITELDLTDPYKLAIVYDNRITLSLGLPTDLTLKLRFAKESIIGAGKLTDSDRGELDLSTVNEESQKAYFTANYSKPPPSSSAPSSAAPDAATTSSIPEVTSETQNTG